MNRVHETFASAILNAIRRPKAQLKPQQSQSRVTRREDVDPQLLAQIEQAAAESERKKLLGPKSQAGRGRTLLAAAFAALKPRKA